MIPTDHFLDLTIALILLGVGLWQFNEDDANVYALGPFTSTSRGRGIVFMLLGAAYLLWFLWLVFFA